MPSRITRTVSVASVLVIGALILTGCGEMAQYGLFGIAHVLERTVYAIVSVTNPSDAKVKEYLRDKYDKEFIAVDRSPSTASGHFLYAPADAPEDVFDVVTKGTYAWTDGYQLLLARRAGQPEVERIVKKYLPDATDIWYSIRVPRSIQVCSIGWSGDTGECLEEIVVARVGVRLHLKGGDSDAIKIAFEQIMDEMVERKLSGSSTSIIVLPSDIPTDIERLTPTGGNLSYIDGVYGMKRWYLPKGVDEPEIKYHGFGE